LIDLAAVLKLYDAQMRRDAERSDLGALVERTDHVVRYSMVDGRGWSGVVWSDLSEANADDVIREQIAFYASIGQRFEWKRYDYDAPEDLGVRLIRAGLEEQEPEAVMVHEASSVAGMDPPLPDGVRLVHATDEAGVDLLIRVHEDVFGTDHSELRRSLVDQVTNDPESTVLVVAMHGDEPVSSGRVQFPERSDFAGLWGGSTMPEWRGKGLYRALVAHRAALAAERGFRYVQVDAGPESRPILERLGFERLAWTIPYVWEPEG
jgi:GNAT superfamily N-acetyltransferase